MAAEKKSVSDDILLKQKVNLSTTQLSYVKRILIRSLIEKGSLSYNERCSPTISFPKLDGEEKELADNFSGIITLLKTHIKTLRNVPDQSTIDIIKLYKSKIEKNPHLQEINTFLENVLAITEYNPLKASDLQNRTLEFMTTLSSRRFDSSLSSEIWRYLESIKLSTNMKDLARAESIFFVNYDEVLMPVCKILGGQSLTEAEITKLQKARTPLLFLQCADDEKLKSLPQSFDLWFLALRADLELRLKSSVGLSSTPPGGPALLQDSPAPASESDPDSSAAIKSSFKKV